MATAVDEAYVAIKLPLRSPRNCGVLDGVYNSFVATTVLSIFFRPFPMIVTIMCCYLSAITWALTDNARSTNVDLRFAGDTPSRDTLANRCFCPGAGILRLRLRLSLIPTPPLRKELTNVDFTP